MLRRNGFEYVLRTESVPRNSAYYFVAVVNGREQYFGRGGRRIIRKRSPREPVRLAESYWLSTYVEDEHPAWLNKGVVYQVLPDRFFRDSRWEERVRSCEGFGDRPRAVVRDWDSDRGYRSPNADNDRFFYGGSLDGVREKIPYLKSLGVTEVYLNPIFSAGSYHRYDIWDYDRIDPFLGDETSLRKLSEELGRNGMRLILDLVLLVDERGRYFDKCDVTGQGVCTHPDTSPFKDWIRRGEDGGYFINGKYFWMLAFNTDDPGFLEYFLGENGIVPRLVEMGVSGLRVDFPLDIDRGFVLKLRERTRAMKKDFIIVGEYWNPASTNVDVIKTDEHLNGGLYDSFVGFTDSYIFSKFLTGHCTAYDSARDYGDMMSRLSTDCVFNMLNNLDNHDVDRVYSTYVRYFGRKAGTRKTLTLVAVLYCLPGIPVIYYGDEVGIEQDVIGDLNTNRKPFPWGRENKKFLAHYRRLGRIRSEHPVLSDGSIEIDCVSDHAMEITRRDGKDVVVCLFTCGAAVTRHYDRDMVNLFTGEVGRDVSVEADGFAVLSLVGPEGGER